MSKTFKRNLGITMALCFGPIGLASGVATVAAIGGGYLAVAAMVVGSVASLAGGVQLALNNDE